MPIYEYQCDDCGGRIEAMHRWSDPPLTSCEACGGSLRKLLSAPAFQFKGSGWYVTDYARKGASGGGGDGPAKAAEKANGSPAADSGESKAPEKSGAETAKTTKATETTQSASGSSDS